MTAFTLTERGGPLLISAPHVGTELPAGFAARLTAVGQSLIDTDWDVDRLYGFAEELDATVLRAHWSRYVVDLNRDPNGVPLYPGARTTGLCPTETFEGEPLYVDGAAPDDTEITARRAAFWEPYHAALHAQLERIRAQHGYALLLDAHSIWGRLPLLFEGELPDVNLGTNSGASCNTAIVAGVEEVVSASPYSFVTNGRFKGGYITRQHGNPAAGIHALQIELNQKNYLADGSRTEYDAAKAASLSAILRNVTTVMLSLSKQNPPQSQPSETHA
jgi:N-formylglutamate deformylase